MRSFWFGDDPREDTGRFDPAGQFRLAQLLELFAGHELAAFEPGLTARSRLRSPDSRR